MKRDYNNETRVFVGDLCVGDLITFGGKKPYQKVMLKTERYIMVEGDESTKILLDNFCMKYNSNQLKENK